MKKLVLGLNVFFLTCALAISTVAAAPSPTNGVEAAVHFNNNAVVVTESGVVVDLAAVEVLMTEIEANADAIAAMYPELPEASLEEIVAMLDSDEAQAIIADIMDITGAQFDVTELMNLDLVAEGDIVTLEDGSVQVTFVRPNVAEGDNYEVLHFNEETGTWETVDTVVSDGKIVATFTSFSPVAVVTWTTPSTTVDTGDTASVVPYAVAFVAAAAVLTIVVIKKKSAA